jgi:hypothetical protein
MQPSILPFLVMEDCLFLDLMSKEFRIGSIHKKYVVHGGLE